MNACFLLFRKPCQQEIVKFPLRSGRRKKEKGGERGIDFLRFKATGTIPAANRLKRRSRRIIGQNNSRQRGKLVVRKTQALPLVLSWAERRGDGGEREEERKKKRGAGKKSVGFTSPWRRPATAPPTQRRKIKLGNSIPYNLEHRRAVCWRRSPL